MHSYLEGATTKDMEIASKKLSEAASAVQALCNYLHGEEPKKVGP